MLSSILTSAIDKINSASSLSEIEEIRIEFLGKAGLISQQMRQLATLQEEEKRKFGSQINEVKQKIESSLSIKKDTLKTEALNQKLESESIDITLPAREIKIGKIHPISQAKKELIEIFGFLGFSVKEGPVIESDWYNFTALNIDENHPARQDHDTFYIGNEDRKTVLRTHTSPVQIRTMESGKPPFKFIAPGRTYRSDYDQTHTPMFHQLELLAVDKNITMRDLKSLIEKFISVFFEGQNPEVRFRPSFFPFTTPSAEVDIKFAGGKWLEVLGCGMIHPNVLRNAKIDPDQYQGYAAGLGIERMAMLKYGIDDLRQFYESDIRWLKHFGFSAFDIPTITSGLTK